MKAYTITVDWGGCMDIRHYDCLDYQTNDRDITLKLAERDPVHTEKHIYLHLVKNNMRWYKICSYVGDPK